MEELKLILDAVTQLGAAGKEAFIYWLIFDKLVGPLIIALTTAAIAIAVVVIVKTANDNDKALGELRDMLGIGTPGYVSNAERVQLKVAVAKLIAAKGK